MNNNTISTRRLKDPRNTRSFVFICTEGDFIYKNKILSALPSYDSYALIHKMKFRLEFKEVHRKFSLVLFYMCLTDIIVLST